MAEESLSDKMQRVIELLEKNNTKVRLPKLSEIKKRKGYCLVWVLRTNGWSKIYKLPIEDNVVKVPSIISGDLPTYHEVGAEHIFFYKKYPVVFIPEWDMKPISKPQLMKEAKKEERLTFAEKYIFSRMKRDLITSKRMGIGAIIAIIAIIGGLLIAANYFGLFG